MLKKSITLLAVVAVAGVAFATESAPSNTVGFVTVNVSDVDGAKNHITIQPRGTELNGDPTEIWGAQFIGGNGPGLSDVLEQYTYAGGWDILFRLPNGVWQGSITGIDHNKSYLFVNRHGAANTTKVFAGDVIPEGTYVDMGIVKDAFRTFIANPLPMQRPLSGQGGDCYNLLGSGFTSGPPGVGDTIEQYNGVGWDIAFNVGAWQGNIMNLEPGIGYMIADNSVGGGDWNWTFTVGTDVLASEQNSKTRVISSHK
jgi:hypothetical protein